jgi:SAM-dependent methyltransferase
VATVEEVLCAAIASTEFVSASVTGLDAVQHLPAVAHFGSGLIKITIRPIDLATGRHLQFASFDGRRTHTVNLQPSEAIERFASIIECRSERRQAARVYLRTTVGDLQLTHSRKGVARLIRHGASIEEVSTDHDRTKERRVAEDAAFLKLTGISDATGRVKPTARAKYRQVEQFLEILDHTMNRDHSHLDHSHLDHSRGEPGEDTGGPVTLPTGRPLRALDLGCGAGVLTLATYHDLSVRLGLPMEMVGIDTNTDLISRLTATVKSLQWDHIRFIPARIPTEIDEYRLLVEPNIPPNQPIADLVIALHACDTATDDALALAVRGGASWILTAPCCQHHLQAQINIRSAPKEFGPMLRHGIVTERLGDLLTDALRAEILRAHGYRSDVIEFVSTEHTGKNLMIRSVRTGRPDPIAATAAQSLAEIWNVTPALAERIGYGPD